MAWSGEWLRVKSATRRRGPVSVARSGRPGPGPGDSSDQKRVLIASTRTPRKSATAEARITLQSLGQIPAGICQASVRNREVDRPTLERCDEPVRAKGGPSEATMRAGLGHEGDCEASEAGARSIVAVVLVDQ